MALIPSILQDGEDVDMPALRAFLATVDARGKDTGAAIATGTIAALIGDRVFDTAAMLPNAPEPDSYALVTFDGDSALNGLWKKVGAAGSPGWEGPSTALVGPGLTEAEQTKVDHAADTRGAAFVGVIDMGGNRLFGLSSPASSTDAVPRSFVTDLVAGVAADLQLVITGETNELRAMPRMVATEEYQPISANPRSSVISDMVGPWNGYMWAVTSPQDERSGLALGTWLAGLAGHQFIRVTPIDRLLSAGDAGGTVPGTAAGDLIGESFTLPIPLLDIHNRINTVQPVTLDISPAGPLQPGYIRFCMLEVLDADAEDASLQTFSVGKGQPLPSGSPSWQNGWFRDGTTWIPLSASNALAFVFSRKSERQQNADIGYVAQTAPTPNPFGPDKVIPAVVRRDTAGVSLASIGDIDFDPVAQVTLTDAMFTMKPGQYTPLPVEPLAGSVVVRRAADDALLNEWTDYRIDYASGSIVGQIAELSIKVSDIGLPIRYDVVYEDINSRAIGVMKGPARGWDACEYIPRVTASVGHPEYSPGGPTLPVGARPLYVVRNNWTGEKIIPVHNWRNQRRLGQYAEEESWLRYCREYFAPLLARARAGLPITLTGVGASPTALGDDQRIDVPNGDRDTIAFFQNGRIASDTLARILLHGGDMGANMHQHLGWNWFIKAALAAAGSNVTYLNMGLSGSSTRPVPRGLTNADRLAHVASTNAHLVVADFAENDKGQTYIYEDAVTFVQMMRASSPQTLIMLVPPLFNARFSTTVTAEMAGTAYEQVKQAAIDCRVAWLDHALICGPGNEGSFGHAIEDRSLQNGINHAGPSEYVQVGRFAARSFIV